MRYHLIFLSLCLFGCTRPAQLITAAGKYSGPGENLSVDVVSFDAAHIGWRVEWRHANAKGTTSVSALGSTKTLFPVIAGRWAFYFPGGDELWFTDGQIYSRFTSGGPAGDDLICTQSCSDPSLVAKAPDVLQQWANRKPNKAPEPTTMSVTSPAAQEPREP